MAMKLNRDQIKNLIRQVVDTNTEEIDCDEMMRVLTTYADKLAAGEVVDISDDATIQHHFEMCPECREEFEMIQAIADEGNLNNESA